MLKKGLIAVSFIIISLFLCQFFYHPADPIQSQTRFLMDTYCTIQVPGDIEVLKVIGKAFDRIEEVEIKFNALNPESPVYKFNNDNIPISDTEIVELVQTALKVSKKSSGKFDITVFPLIDLWGFFTESPEVPDSERLIKALKSVGYNNISIENGTIIKRSKETQIDLGSIAKGYAIAEVKRVLENEGITSALIDAGGDIYAMGTNSQEPWVIGIRNPRGDGVVGALEITDMSVVTSGDYERVFEEGGEKYHHIIDPGTGYPSNGIASMTVISSDPALADAWSTAFFILGKDKTLEIVKELETIEIFMITDDGERIHSSGMPVEIQML